jgi:hypothetical protein
MGRLTSVHLFYGFFCHFRFIEIDISRAGSDPGLRPLGRQIDTLDGSEMSEDLADVILRHVPRQVGDMNLRRLWTLRPFPTTTRGRSASTKSKTGKTDIYKTSQVMILQSFLR